QEGLGKHPALLTEAGALTYADVQDLANRFGRILLDSGVEPEHRVLIALPDVPEFAGALFGTLKLGAVVVMANPGLPQAEIEALLEYTRARALVVHRESAGPVRAVARGSPCVKRVGAGGGEGFGALPGGPC